MFWINKKKHNFVGEDRNFGDSELFVDLVPSSCWFTNVRYCVRKEDWDKIRKIVYSRIEYKCECCGIDCIKNKIPIEAHERWDYDYSTLTQKLVRLIGLCKLCHSTTHFGFAKMNGKEVEVSEHLKRIRNFNLEELKEHIDIAYAVWLERNVLEWNLDISLITSNGYEIIKPVKVEDRKNVILDKLN